jgi:hypothetical protein
MCPVCLTTAALAAAGVTSAGGLMTLVVKTLRAGAKPGDRTPATQGAANGSPKNRIEK